MGRETRGDTVPAGIRDAASYSRPLDALRGVAIALVLAYHVNGVSVGEPEPGTIVNSNAYALAAEVGQGKHGDREAFPLGGIFCVAGSVDRFAEERVLLDRLLQLLRPFDLGLSGLFDGAGELVLAQPDHPGIEDPRRRPEP